MKNFFEIVIALLGGLVAAVVVLIITACYMLALASPVILIVWLIMVLK